MTGITFLPGQGLWVFADDVAGHNAICLDLKRHCATRMRNRGEFGVRWRQSHGMRNPVCGGFIETAAGRMFRIEFSILQ